MTASSLTVLENLAYLIGAVVVAFIGGLIVWIRHRQPKSVDANMASFRRGLSALAPDPRTAPPARPEPTGIRTVPASLTHVRRGAASGTGSRRPPAYRFAGPAPDNDIGGSPAAEEADGEWTGGQSG